MHCDADPQVPQQHGSEQQTGHGVDAVGGRQTGQQAQRATLDMLPTTPSPLTCHELPLLKSLRDAWTIYGISGTTRTLQCYTA